VNRDRDPIAMGIKQIIEDKGLLKGFVAKSCGYTKQQFSDMLNGRKVIRASDIQPIAQAIGVTVQDVYDAGAAYLQREGA